MRLTRQDSYQVQNFSSRSLGLRNSDILHRSSSPSYSAISRRSLYIRASNHHITQRIKSRYCRPRPHMGARHALHFPNHTPRAELIAMSTPNDREIERAKPHLEPSRVALYKSYDEMLQHDGLEAVVIVSITEHRRPCFERPWSISRDRSVMILAIISTENQSTDGKSLGIMPKVLGVLMSDGNISRGVQCGFSRRCCVSNMFDSENADVSTKVGGSSIK